MQGSSIRQFASIALLLPCLACEANAAFDPQTLKTGATPRPAIATPAQKADGEKRTRSTWPSRLSLSVKARLSRR